MTDVREGVARAIHAQARKNDERTIEPWESNSGDTEFAYLLADASLSAIGYEEIVGALEEALSMLEAYEESATGEKFNSPKINAALRKARGEP